MSLHSPFSEPLESVGEGDHPDEQKYTELAAIMHKERRKHEKKQQRRVAEGDRQRAEDSATVRRAIDDIESRYKCDLLHIRRKYNFSSYKSSEPLRSIADLDDTTRARLEEDIACLPSISAPVEPISFWRVYRLQYPALVGRLLHHSARVEAFVSGLDGWEDVYFPETPTYGTPSQRNVIREYFVREAPLHQRAPIPSYETFERMFKLTFE